MIKNTNASSDDRNEQKKKHFTTGAISGLTDDCLTKCNNQNNQRFTPDMGCKQDIININVRTIFYLTQTTWEFLKPYMCDTGDNKTALAFMKKSKILHEEES